MPFRKGETVVMQFVVSEADIARFESGPVHAVYSTFALARDAEWTTRQFVLKGKKPDEEGVGTMVLVRHKAPAFVGECVTITGRILSYSRGYLKCSFRASVGKRLIATGQTGQRVLPRRKLQQLLSPLRYRSLMSEP
ncbi:MAG: hypothetical protein NZL95_08145 [Chitinophagales bacterium]|nr:hypothetical protein [Chitinophagales bacterium]MDW8428507.1 hypothetical protein [Chitinophagales bacterium]